MTARTPDPIHQTDDVPRCKAICDDCGMARHFEWWNSQVIRTDEYEWREGVGWVYILTTQTGEKQEYRPGHCTRAARPHMVEHILSDETQVPHIRDGRRHIHDRMQAVQAGAG